MNLKPDFGGWKLTSPPLKKNLSLEQQLKKQANDRETDLVRFNATNKLLKAQLKESQLALEQKIRQESEERKASDLALELEIQHEERQRKAGDLALFRNVGLPRYSKVGDQPLSRFGSKGSDDGQFSNPESVACKSRGEIIFQPPDSGV